MSASNFKPDLRVVSGETYRYFRIEAAELIEKLNQAVLHLEKTPSSREAVSEMLRLAHTLKGAARVVKQNKVADLSHAIEDLLAPHRQGMGGPVLGLCDGLFRLVDGISAELAQLQQSGSKAERPMAPSPDPSETIRVDRAEIDELLYGSSQLMLRLAGLKTGFTSLDNRVRKLRSLIPRIVRSAGAKSPANLSLEIKRIFAPALEDLEGDLHRFQREAFLGVERAEQELGRIHQRTSELRLLPASSVFSVLKRSVRDAAQVLGKNVEFEASGGEIRLDAHVLSGLRDALVQIARNGVAHGIEEEGERISMGKPAGGTIRLSVERRGSRVAFLCSDDGRGMDVDALRAMAAKRGLVSGQAAAGLSLDQLWRLVLDGGMSTTSSVTQVSGRGIGLNVVRESVSRLKAEVRITSERSKGTTIDVCVPVSNESLSAIAVIAGGLRLSLPIDCVVETLQIRESELLSSVRGRLIWRGDQGIPFVPLHKLLRKDPIFSDDHVWAVCLVREGERVVALGVDRILGIVPIVMRPLPAFAPVVGEPPLVSGVFMDGEGNPEPVLDPKGLIELALSEEWKVAFAPSAERKRLLVIDDSLTSRMLEQSILESAGYVVDTATSGEEGLRKAKTGKFQLFVVDVEMPGMSGFDFVEHAKSDGELKEIPAVLVTSRNTADDFQRGEAVGANGYVVKGEFDERHFLRLIKNLVG